VFTPAPTAPPYDAAADLAAVLAELALPPDTEVIRV
jgi:hypothetical protein